jgi:hypothetical protein
VGNKSEEAKFIGLFVAGNVGVASNPELVQVQVLFLLGFSRHSPAAMPGKRGLADSRSAPNVYPLRPTSPNATLCLAIPKGLELEEDFLGGVGRCAPQARGRSEVAHADYDLLHW